MATQAGMQKVLKSSYEQALSRVPEALKSEGFGVLTEIDVQKTLKNKLGADFRRYEILGACNPPFAHRALGTNLAAGLLMPCNVIVYENDEGTATVLAVDPRHSVAALGEPALEALAEELSQKLGRVLERLQ